LGILILTLAPAFADAQGPRMLEPDDVYFQYRPAHNFTRTGTNLTRQAPKNAVGLCGFSIRGNHHSRANPRVEWDLNIDELIEGTTRIAGISAGTFDVAGHGRKARSPIVELSFLIEGESQAIPARIVGSPNADNAIKAMLETEPANRLFTAFSDTQLVTISLKYADNTADVLQIRAWHDSRKFGRGKNSYFNQCLRGDTPDPHGRPVYVR
jgi:hypothetical protein